MIQRKQSLFLLLLVLSGIVLLFIASNTVTINGVSHPITLVPSTSADYSPTSWHLTAIGLNFLVIVLAFVTILVYNKRELQIKLCYVLMLLELGLTLIISFCPLIVKTELITIENSGFGSLIGIVGMMSAYLAARNIKKDIELLKSADRIR